MDPCSIFQQAPPIKSGVNEILFLVSDVFQCYYVFSCSHTGQSLLFYPILAVMCCPGCDVTWYWRACGREPSLGCRSWYQGLLVLRLRRASPLKSPLGGAVSRPKASGMIRTETRDGDADAGARSPTSQPGGKETHKHSCSVLDVGTSVLMGLLQCRVFLFILYYNPSVFGAAGLSERTREACSNTHSRGFCWFKPPNPEIFKSWGGNRIRKTWF